MYLFAILNEEVCYVMFHLLLEVIIKHNTSIKCTNMQVNSSSFVTSYKNNICFGVDVFIVLIDYVLLLLILSSLQSVSRLVAEIYCFINFPLPA